MRPANTRTEIFRRLVSDHAGPAPVRLSAATSVREAVERMREERSSCAIVVDAGGRPRGIVTEQDIVRRVAFATDPGQPVSTVMTAPVLVIEQSRPLFQAVALMRRRGLRHIPVVDGSGAVSGMLALHEALAVLSEQTMHLIDELTHEESLEGLRAVKGAQAELAFALFEDGVPVPEVQALLTDINRDIHRRILRREIAAMTENGWGEPPVAFALIIMGSGGRGENFLFPDQDNGFILDDYDDAGHARIDAYFIELAERMTQRLDAVGFPLCRGNVMATNPVWRKALGQWRDQLRYWMGRRSAAMMRSSDIFFDFAHAFGEARLSSALRDFVTEITAQNPGYLKDMFQNQINDRVALGWFGRLATQRDEEGRRGMVNLKYGGTLPLVECVRLLALRHRVPFTSTLARIEALAERGVIEANVQDYLTGAVHHITYLLLRQQVTDFRAGRRVGNFVPVASLTKREKDYLVACFRAIEDLRGRLKLEFGSTFV